MAAKILEVLESVAMHGPATLDQITDKLPRTRSSVYRALVNLERSGWIRRSLNGRCFTITSKMEELSVNQFFASACADKIINTLKRMNLKLEVLVILHVKGTEFSIVDSSQYPLQTSIEGEETLTNLICEMQSEGLINIPGFNIVNKTTHSKTLLTKELRKDGCLAFDFINTCIIPIKTMLGELMFIVLSDKKYTRTSPNDTRLLALDCYGLLAEQGLNGFRQAHKSDAA